jgi:hypothetical protein
MHRRSASLRSRGFRASSGVHLMETSPCARASRAVIGVFTLAAFLIALTLAAAPGLHSHFHADAGTAQHECAVTGISNGKVQIGDAAAVVPPPAAPVSVSAVSVLRPAWVQALFLAGALLEHAPPSLS